MADSVADFLQQHGLPYLCAAFADDSLMNKCQAEALDDLMT